MTQLEPAEVAPYLERYGYSAECTGPSSAADAKWPQLMVQVTGHSEAEKHTMYTIEFSLVLSGAGRINWSVSRRLSQLRESLHAQVKSELGKYYEKSFTDAPFA